VKAGGKQSNQLAEILDYCYQNFWRQEVRKCYSLFHENLMHKFRHFLNIILSGVRLSQFGTAATEKVKGKIIPVQAVEALRGVRDWGSHIFRQSAHRWR
jgi:hypothetical protein